MNRIRTFLEELFGIGPARRVARDVQWEAEREAQRKLRVLICELEVLADGIKPLLHAKEDWCAALVALLDLTSRWNDRDFYDIFSELKRVNKRGQ